MTNQALAALAGLTPFAIGFDEVFKTFADMHATQLKELSYPPYNIVRVDEKTYLIEMAVAGFSRQDIEVVLDGSTLKVTAKTKERPEENLKVDLGLGTTAAPCYLYKGIAERFFTKMFKLSDTVEVKNAELVNGILKIWLENLSAKSGARKIEVAEPMIGDKTVKERVQDEIALRS